jgi:hypothetical protein
MQIIWSWPYDQSKPNSGVNFRPLDGNWGGISWGKQSSRCSNNGNLGPGPFGDFYGEYSQLIWTVSSIYDDSTKISFDVAIDQPDTDLTVLKNQSDNHLSSNFTMHFVTNKPLKNSARGIYICNVNHATQPFTIVVTAPDPAPGPPIQ